jgi:hypothetical protein
MSSIPPKPKADLDWDQSSKLWEQRINRDFNRFAGKEVKRGDEHDPVLKEMQREAMGHYSSLRLVWPHAAAAAGSRDITRINAHMEQGADGKWTVGQKFTVG